MPRWHADDFELKLCEKQLVQEEYADPRLFP